jgi:hypothetical protein
MADKTMLELAQLKDEIEFFLSIGEYPRVYFSREFFQRLNKELSIPLGETGVIFGVPFEVTDSLLVGDYFVLPKRRFFYII